MINISEIRVGNILLMKITDSWQARPIKVNEFLALSEHPEWVKPLDISEEILLKCGFEKIAHFTVMNSLIYKLGRNRQLSIGCVGTPNEMLFITEVDDDDKPTKVNDLICLHNFDYDGKLYLHKLQNIVAIFGQELNTNNFI